MKKAIAISFVIFSMCLIMTSCGKSKDNNDSTAKVTTSQTTTVTTKETTKETTNTEKTTTSSTTGKNTTSKTVTSDTDTLMGDITGAVETVISGAENIISDIFETE